MVAAMVTPIKDTPSTPGQGAIDQGKLFDELFPSPPITTSASSSEENKAYWTETYKRQAFKEAAAAPDEFNKKVSAAWEQAERLAADTRFNHDHKAQEIAKLADDTKAAIDDYAAKYIGKLEAEIPTYRAQSALSFIPGDLDAAQLNYALAVMPKQWEQEKQDIALINRWESALSTGDKITAKICLDLLPMVLRERYTALLRDNLKDADMRRNYEYAGSLPEQARIDKLTQDTITLLRTVDQRRAAAKMDYTAAVLDTLTTAQLRAKLRMNMTYDRRNGKVIEDTSVILGRGRNY